MSDTKMRRYLSLTLFLFWPFFGVVWATAITVKVIGVIDGDTIKILQNGKTVRIRLHGIDCPEKNQPFGQKAKQFTSDLVYGKAVTIIRKDMDSYGRVVAEVFVDDSISLNQELLRAGLAWWYKRYASGNLTLKQLEENARKAGIGLWGVGKAVPPWEWRKGKKNGHQF